MAEPSYRRLLWSLVLLGTTLDQVSKYGVFKWLYPEAVQTELSPEGRWNVVPGAFRLLAKDAPCEAIFVV